MYLSAKKTTSYGAKTAYFDILFTKFKYLSYNKPTLFLFHSTNYAKTLMLCVSNPCNISLFFGDRGTNKGGEYFKCLYLGNYFRS